MLNIMMGLAMMTGGMESPGGKDLVGFKPNDKSRFNPKPKGKRAKRRAKAKMKGEK